MSNNLKAYGWDGHTYIKDKITIAALVLVALGLLLLVALAVVHPGPDVADAIKTAINAFSITGVIVLIFEYVLHTRFAQLFEEKVDNLWIREIIIKTKNKSNFPNETDSGTERVTSWHLNGVAAPF